DNPFLALQDEMDILKAEFRNNPTYVLTSKDQQYKQIKIYLEQCNGFVDTAFRNSAKYGISSKINQSLLKIKQQINRISDIINLLVINKEEDYLENSKKMIFNILSYKSNKNDIAELFNDSTRLISHLITNHTAETGTHYITSTMKDYLKMFWKASGGGVVVGVLCVLKMLYSYSPGSEFSHAFMYAFNYAMGFVMIYLMGFTLATKQPAMTAATMAKLLSDEKNTRRNYVEFAHLISNLMRTQFIAFVGNVLWAFPVSLAIIYGLDVLFNQNFATDKSVKLLKDLDPFQSKALFHASIAGVFLFISGIISGNIGNSSIYYNIPNRIAKNPMIKRIFGENTAKSISGYYSKNWAGIMSNVWFGVFMGVTAPIGAFFGLDLDIRHITFAAGNLALGLYGKDFIIDSYSFWVCFTTVFLIGFFNFIVSFGLSMLLAFRSRKVKGEDIRKIFREVIRYFFKKPLMFFVPIRSKELDVKAQEMMHTEATKPKED
ncbi:MAG: recombinase, partial [Bergeyella zoohelcum]|nr:recombinase [Bergeyella zoohelcum]